MSEYIYDTSRVETQPEQGFTGEEIVRCRDCKYYKEKVYKWVNNWTRTEKTCEVFDGCRVDSDGFCKWGERREK